MAPSFEDTATKQNKAISERLEQLNAISAQINSLLDGLTYSEISLILDGIDRNIRQKSVYKPQLPDSPVIHGYSTA